MNNNSNDKTDAVLEKAFVEYIRREDKEFPSEKELRELYPPNEEKCLRYGKSARRGERGSSAAIKVLRRVAAVVLALISVFFGVLMMNENVRGAVGETIVKWTGGVARFDFSETGAESDAPEDPTEPARDVGINDVSIGYIPENLVITEDPDFIGKTLRVVRLTVEKERERDLPSAYSTNPFVVIEISRTDDIVHTFYPFLYESGYMAKINEKSAFVFNFRFPGKEMSSDGYEITFGDRNITVRVVGYWISKTKLMKIAENIVW